MIQGTGSGAGKSLITAAFCRIFSDLGVRVAPFKAQNMALNSSIAVEGGEIGRAQELQARAARLESSVDMNPVLLKTAGDHGSQVILRGKVHATMKARDYYAFRDEAWKTVTASYERLSRKYDLIIMEGAGSPAEINLLDVDIVNMAMAKHAKAPVLLVGDIDKGGVFASLYGTVKLLGRDSRQIKAFIINKFRGDRSILDPGLEMIRERTGRPVIGVLPYISDLGLPEEDGLALKKRSGVRSQESGEKAIKVIVVRLRSISNFTDFDPFELEPDVELGYSDSPDDIRNADLIILPGSKNTVADLLALKEKKLDACIRTAYDRGTQIVGVCGGYQMLGLRIDDPHGAESCHRSVEGLGILNIETRFGPEKTTCRAEAEINPNAEFGMHPALAQGTRTAGHRRIADWNGHERLKGYEIHMGDSTGDIGLFKVRRTLPSSELRTLNSELILDGSMNRNCWGTYLHGIFDNDRFRRDILDQIRTKKGLPPLNGGVQYRDRQEHALDRLASIVREHLDMDFIRGMVRL